MRIFRSVATGPGPGRAKRAVGQPGPGVAMRNTQTGRNGRLPGLWSTSVLNAVRSALDRCIALPGFHSHCFVSLVLASVPVGFLLVSRCCHLLADLGQKHESLLLGSARGRSHRSSVSILDLAGSSRNFSFFWLPFRLQPISTQVLAWARRPPG